MIFGIVMEVVQPEISPLRCFEWGDAIANAFGAVGGGIVWMGFAEGFKETHSSNSGDKDLKGSSDLDTGAK